MIDWEPILDTTVAVLAARAAVLLAALAIDWLVGEPDILWRRVPHPVVLFGRAISFMDKRLNRRRGVTGKSRQARGILAIVILVVLAAMVGWGLSFGGPVATCVIMTVLLAARSLDEHIRAVATAMGAGIGAARTAVGMIVGRETKSMKKGDIARAAIETGAENLSDGVIAPALWFLVGGLPGLLAYKMVNTADSMIGYRNAKYRAFGCGAARIDDVMNLIPARLTALLICGSAMLNGRGTAALGTMMRDGRHHASPNAGWPEAAMAGGINVWLAGPRRYGNRIRQARRFNEGGGEADASAIRAALQVLIMAQLLFALLILPAVLL